MIDILIDKMHVLYLSIFYLGMLVGVPIHENEAAFGIQEAVDKALAEAQQQNIKGKQITPFLLAR